MTIEITETSDTTFNLEISKIDISEETFLSAISNMLAEAANFDNDAIDYVMKTLSIATKNKTPTKENYESKR